MTAAPGSLREAVKYANANANTTIKFAADLHGTIKLTSGELAITRSTVIDGPGAVKLAVSGTGHSRVFTISPGITVTISGLTITRGLADSNASEAKGLRRRHLESRRADAQKTPSCPTTRPSAPPVIRSPSPVMFL